MSLEDKALLPRFFAPYRTEIEIPEDDYITGDFPNFDEDVLDNGEGLQFFLHKFFQNAILAQEDDCPPGTYYKDYGVFQFPPLIENREPRWQVQAAWDMSNQQRRPHIKCMMVTNADGSEGLLRGDLVTIIDIMRTRLRTKSLLAHVDAPVLLYSFLDSRVRVLQAHWNGKELVVRTTKLYDFRKDNEREFELSIHLARWWLGNVTDTPTTE